MSNDSEAKALAHIEELVGEEHRLFEQAARSEADEQRLKSIQVQLDQCWDLLRQRRALVETGRDPSAAALRGPEVVERYKG